MKVLIIRVVLLKANDIGVFLADERHHFCTSLFVARPVVEVKIADIVAHKFDAFVFIGRSMIGESGSDERAA